MIKEQVIEELNKYFKQDPRAITALFSQYVPANDKLAADPNIQVRGFVDGSNFLSPIGLINGLLMRLGEDMIALKVDADTNSIAGFIEYSGATPKTEAKEQ